MSDVIWLHEVSRKDVDLVGQKAAYLGELINAKLPVPKGFVITTEAFNQVFAEIKNDVERLVNSVDMNRLDSLNYVATEIRKLFLGVDLPLDLKDDISRAYDKMHIIPKEYENVNKIALDFIRAGRDRPFLMLRASPTLNCSPSQQASFLDIKSKEDLFNKLKLCWFSIFTPRSIYFRKKRRLPNPEIAVIIQKRVNLLKSGSIFTVNPLDNNKNQLLIQARWGFSEKDAPESDIYVYNKQSKEVESKDISQQEDIYIFDPQVMRVAKRDLSSELKSVDTLSTKELELIDNVSRKINSLFKFPQDIEWGVAKGKFYVLQSRPITSIFKKPIISSNENSTESAIIGLPASAGNIRRNVCMSPKNGDILVTKGLGANAFSVAFGVAGLILEKGDLKSIGSMVARDLEIPCMVRARNATEKLSDGQAIKLDAFSGKVFLDQISEISQPSVQKDYTLNDSVNTGTFGSQSQESVTDVSIINSDQSNAENSSNHIANSDPHPINLVLGKLSDLETTLTNLVLQEAQKRKESPHATSGDKSKLISELEWDVRSLREKVEKAVSKLDLNQDSMLNQP